MRSQPKYFISSGIEFDYYRNVVYFEVSWILGV